MAAQDPATVDDGAFAFRGDQVLTFFANGQSTANGCSLGRGLTLAPVRPGRVGMLASGVRILDNAQDEQFRTQPLDEAALSAGFVDARETVHRNAAETGWALAGRRMTDPGLLPETTAVLVGTAGIGRAAFEETGPGSIPYDNLLRWHRRARVLAHRDGKGFRVGGLFWCGYEASLKKSLEANLDIYRQMVAATETDLRPLNDDPSLPIFVITDQVASCGFFDARRGDAITRVHGHSAAQPLAALHAALAIPGVILACPRYFLRHELDHVHLTDEAAALRGEYFGRIAVRALKGEHTLPLHIADTQRDGDRIVLTYEAPAPPVRINLAGPVTDPGDFGFEWLGEGRIEGVAVTGAAEITLQLSAAGPGELRYAMQVFGLQTGPQTGPRGCVSDSSPDTSVYGLPMVNWAAVQRVTIK